tara:strand:+ start:1454 stop:1765 length:312 start_codon:yes stop_codon:yes gene_type:complete
MLANPIAKSGIILSENDKAKIYEPARNFELSSCVTGIVRLPKRFEVSVVLIDSVINKVTKGLPMTVGGLAMAIRNTPLSLSGGFSTKFTAKWVIVPLAGITLP